MFGIARRADIDSFEDALLDMPAMQAPPGMKSNFIDPPNRKDLSLGILITSFVITTTMTSMRIYVKTFVAKKMTLEDYLLIVAFAFEMGHFAPAWHVYSYDPVLHQWDITVRDISKFLLDFHVGAIFYDVTILVLKLGILVQFLRVFVPTGERSLTFWTTHILIWTNTIFYVIIVFIEIFACKPMEKLWNPLITEGKCLNTPLEYLMCASFNFALDALILLWTQKVIWSLQMSTARKFKVAVLFFAGLFACIFGGLGVYTNVRLLHTKDQAYVGALMALYTFPETTSGFLVLCLPVLPKFAKAMKEALVPASTASSGATPCREDSGRAQRLHKKSWWHISEGSSFSKTTYGTTSDEGNDMNISFAEEATKNRCEDRPIVEYLSFPPEEATKNRFMDHTIVEVPYVAPEAATIDRWEDQTIAEVLSFAPLDLDLSFDCESPRHLR